jgi:hypothetical protein
MDDTLIMPVTGVQMMWLVDTHGEQMVEIEEPGPASILLVDGLQGTAWQRHSSGGLWHSTTGARRKWNSFFTGKCRNVVLVYAAPFSYGEVLG